MSESPAEKPVLRLTAMIEIQFESHGLLRFKRWTIRSSTTIARLCNEELAPRPFAEHLLAQQAADPVLTQEELNQWPETELKEVAIGWWQGAEQGRTSPIPVDSLEAFKSAVHQRNAEHTDRLNASVRTIGGLAFKIPEPSAFERLTRDLSRSLSEYSKIAQFGHNILWSKCSGTTTCGLQSYFSDRLLDRISF